MKRSSFFVVFIVLTLFGTTLEAQSNFLLRDRELTAASDSANYAKIDAASLAEYEDLVKKSNFTLIQENDSVYSIKFDEATELGIQKIMEKNRDNKLMYNRFGTTNLDSLKSSLNQEYLYFSHYYKEDEPYPVDNKYGDIYVHPAVSTYTVTSDRGLQDVYINAEIAFSIFKQMALVDAYKDPNEFARMNIYYGIPNDVDPMNLEILSQLFMDHLVDESLVKEIIGDCYHYLELLKEEIDEYESQTLLEDAWQWNKSFSYAVVDLFRNGYWEMDNGYKINGSACMSIISSATAAYGMDIIDFDNQRNYTDFVEIEDMMKRFNMDFTKDENSKAYLENIRMEYNTKYKTDGAPELFKDSVYTFNQSPSRSDLSGLILASSEKPQIKTKYKVLKLLGGLANTDSDISLEATSYMSSIMHLDNVNYLMELAYHDPTIGQPRKMEFVNTTYFENRSVEDNQAYAVSALANMYKQAEAMNELVIKEYIGDFLKGVTKSSNHSSANIASEALGLAIPYPSNGTWNTINDWVVGLANFGKMSMAPRGMVKVPKWLKFGSKTAPATNVIKNSSMMFSETGSMVLSLPSVISPLKAATTIPGVTTAVWKLPTVVLNSQRSMDAIFMMTRIITIGAVVQTEAGSFYVDTKSHQVLPVEGLSSARSSELAAIKNNPVYISVSSGGSSYSYVVGLAKAEQLSVIIEHLRLLALANPGMFINLKDKQGNPIELFPKKNKLPEVPAQMEKNISDALKSAGVSPVDEAAIINSFKNGTCNSIPKIENIFIDGNVMSSTVATTILKDGSIVLNILRTIVAGGELIELDRTFTRSADGTTLEAAILKSKKAPPLVLSSEQLAELEGLVAMYNNMCKGR